jgi:hypothetical protein
VADRVLPPPASGVLDLAIEIDQEAVLRGLGYAGGNASERVRRRLDAARWESGPLLAGRGAWRVVEGTRAAALGVPASGPEVGLALCTIGSVLENAAARHSANGDLLDALLLDTIGSVAAEAAAEAMNRQLCAMARTRGLYAGARCSPGYPGWALEKQVDLLALLPAAQLGVKLTEGLMMVPRKSVSFAVPFQEAMPAQGGGPCARCGRQACGFRQ